MIRTLGPFMRVIGMKILNTDGVFDSTNREISTKVRAKTLADFRLLAEQSDVYFHLNYISRIGMWYKHQRQGEGKMTWLDRKGGKEIFVGQWEAGIQHGKGKHVWFYKRVASSQYPIRNSYEGEKRLRLFSVFLVFCFQQECKLAHLNQYSHKNELYS